MSKHTPGPWTAYCRHISYKGGEWPEDEFLQWDVDGPRTPSGRGEFFQADARLIAAAPDLLEALQNMHLNILEAMRTGGWVPTPLHQSFWEAVQESQAAIAKATEAK